MLERGLRFKKGRKGVREVGFGDFKENFSNQVSMMEG